MVPFSLEPVEQVIRRVDQLVPGRPDRRELPGEAPFWIVRRNMDELAEQAIRCGGERSRA